MARITIDDLLPLETLTPAELAEMFGAGRVNLGVESLEERRLMTSTLFGALESVSSVDNKSTSTFLNSGNIDLNSVTAVKAFYSPAEQVLRIQGTVFSDDIRVMQKGSSVSVGNTKIQMRETIGGIAQTVGLADSVSSKGIQRIEIEGGTGADLISLSVDSATAVKIASIIFGGEGDDVITGGTKGDTIYGGGGKDTINGMAGIDFLYGEGGNDVLLGGAGDDYLLGEDGNDRMLGESGADWLEGGAGNDAVLGGAEADFIAGNLGNDTIEGGDGDDQLYGDAGNDILRGQEGNDLLFGNIGNDSLEGGSGDDKLFGEAGNDKLYGNDDNDELAGGAGNDILEGGLGDDVLRGDEDHDTLKGGDGDDRLEGGLGDDKLYGDAGSDDLAGGAGKNTLVGGAGVDVLEGVPEIQKALLDKGLTAQDIDNMVVAVKAALNGPEAQNLAFNGHQFHVKQVERIYGSNTITYRGRISHVVSNAGDDQIDYQVVVDDAGNVKLDIKIDSQGFKAMVKPLFALAFYNIPAVGRMGYFQRLAAESAVENLVGRLANEAPGQVAGR